MAKCLFVSAAYADAEELRYAAAFLKWANKSYMLFRLIAANAQISISCISRIALPRRGDNGLSLNYHTALQRNLRAVYEP